MSRNAKMRFNLGWESENVRISADVKWSNTTTKTAIMKFEAKNEFELNV